MTRTSSGFTLVEVTIATGLLVVIALGTAQLFGLALRQNMAARDQLMMTLAAARALDQLTASAAAGALTASPSDALDRDYDGFSDLSGQGGGVYARRWLVAFPPEHGGATAAIVVRVFRFERRAAYVQLASLAEAGK